jgi:hypothetical protein
MTPEADEAPTGRSAAMRVFSGTALARRARWRRWRDRAADAVLGLALAAALALTLAPLAVNVLRTEVRASLEAEEAWHADRSVGAATAALLGRRSAGAGDSPAVDPPSQTLAGLR